MLYYILVIVFAITMGFSFSYFFVLINKFQEYFATKKQDQSKWLKLSDVLWRVSLPIIFVITAFIFPYKIIYLLTNENMSKKLISLYFYVFIFSLIIFFLLFIKQGKIKYTKAS